MSERKGERRPQKASTRLKQVRAAIRQEIITAALALDAHWRALQPYSRSVKPFEVREAMEAARGSGGTAPEILRQVFADIERRVQHRRDSAPPMPAELVESTDGPHRARVEKWLKDQGGEDAWKGNRSLAAVLRWARPAGEHWARLYSPEFLDALVRLHDGDASQAEYSIAYLEADPWHFGSGYLKKKLALWFRRVELSEPDRERLRYVILVAFTKGIREELREYVRLGVSLDSPRFRKTVAEFAARSEDPVRWRAERLLIAMEKQDLIREKREYAQTAKPGTWRFAYPAEFMAQVEKLRQGDREGVDYAVRFLEANLPGIANGRMKALLCRELVPAPLTAADEDRLWVAVCRLLSEDFRELRDEYYELADRLNQAGPRVRPPGTVHRAGVSLAGIDFLERYLEHMEKERGGA